MRTIRLPGSCRSLAALSPKKIIGNSWNQQIWELYIKRDLVRATTIFLRESPAHVENW